MALQLLFYCICFYSSVSDDEATEETDILDSADAQLEIVTECWVEPQAGVVRSAAGEESFFQGLDYSSLAESVSNAIEYILFILLRKNDLHLSKGFATLCTIR